MSSTYILKYILVALGAIAAICNVSCKEDEIIFKGPYHVKFTDTLITVKESITEPLKISLHNVGPILSEDILIKYAVEGSARQDKDYSISGTIGEVIIPAGNSFGYIDVNLINNSNNILESQNLIFTITEVSPSKLQIGRSTNGIIGKSFTLVIEDDCILSGTYKALAPDSLKGFPNIENIKISSQDCSHYILSNWDIYITGYFPSSKNLTFIDNGDNTLTIPEQKEEKFNEDNASMMGSGSIDPSTKVITLNIELVGLDDSPNYQVVLYPQ